MDLKGSHVSRLVEVGQVECKRLKVIVDGLVVWRTVVRGELGVDDLWV